jgi:hypothetical protein
LSLCLWSPIKMVYFFSVPVTCLFVVPLSFSTCWQQRFG